MKRILPAFLAALLSLCAIAGGAVTISGTVTSGAAASPVAGATIVICNGSFSGTASGITGSTGAYSITIPAGWTSSLNAPSSMYINLPQASSPCGCPHWATLAYRGANLTLSFNICPSSFTAQGTVTLGATGTPAANAKVYLITQEGDTSSPAPTVILTAIDSTIADAAGGYCFGGFNFHINSMIKAALPATSSAYASYLPTYFGASLLWSGGTVFGSNVWMNPSATVNVPLIAGTNPGGPAFIGGDVALGANKSTAVGDPLAGRLILLTTSADVPVAYTYSDASGKFSFPNLAYGAYKLSGDAWGKANPPLGVTVSAAKPSVSTVRFSENSSSFRGSVAPLGIPNAASTAIALYPNPAQALLHLTGVRGPVTVTLHNTMGAVVCRAAAADGYSLTIPLAGLSAGMYYAEIGTAAGVQRQVIVKE